MLLLALFLSQIITIQYSGKNDFAHLIHFWTTAKGCHKLAPKSVLKVLIISQNSQGRSGRFEGVRTERKVGPPCKPGEGGLGACSPGKFFKFRAQKCHFQLINTKENAIISCLIYISSVIGRVQCLRNKGKKQ